MATSVVENLPNVYIKNIVLQNSSQSNSMCDIEVDIMISSDDGGVVCTNDEFLL